jgi:hypothetical protein
MTAESQFTGMTGTYYVGYILSYRDLIVSMTVGNAPHADLLVTTADCERLIAIQVKTTLSNNRKSGFGQKDYVWAARKPASYGANLLYAFVNLYDGTDDDEPEPDIFFVPSKWGL